MPIQTAQGQGARVVSVVDFGAVANNGLDDSPAFQAALDALQAAGGGVLEIPAGTFDLQQRVGVVVLPGRRAPVDIRIAMRGAGREATRLLGADPAGLLQFETHRNTMHLVLSDFSLLATRPGIEAAVFITNPELGVRVDRGIVIERLRIAGVGDRDYFETGIRTLGQWRPLIRDVFIEGARADGIGRNGFRAKTGVDLSGFYGGGIVRCQVSHVQTGISFVTDGVGEGGVVTDSQIGPCATGVEFFTPGQEPGGLVTRCTIGATDTGVLIDRRRLVQVTDNTLHAWAAGFTDIEVRDSWTILLTGNRFTGEVDGRTHVLVDGYGPQQGERERNSRMAVRTRDFLIANNPFLVPYAEAVRFRGERIFHTVIIPPDGDTPEAVQP